MSGWFGGLVGGRVDGCRDVHNCQTKDELFNKLYKSPQQVESSKYYVIVRHDNRCGACAP